MVIHTKNTIPNLCSHTPIPLYTPKHFLSKNKNNIDSRPKRSKIMTITDTQNVFDFVAASTFKA